MRSGGLFWLKHLSPRRDARSNMWRRSSMNLVRGPETSRWHASVRTNWSARVIAQAPIPAGFTVSFQPSRTCDRGDSAESALRDACKPASRLPRIRSLLILRDGELLTRHCFNGGQPLDIRSASKSVLSALVGIAIDARMLIGVIQRVLPVLGSDAPLCPDPASPRRS